MAYERLHTPGPAHNLVAFRYGNDFIIVYDLGDEMHNIEILDSTKQLTQGIGWIKPSDDH